MADLPDTDGKDLVELLDMLKPIPEPAPISMWPATGGWVWLGLAVAALLGWAGWRLWHWWRSNAYRRAALAELGEAGEDPARIAAILRRTALAAYPRQEVAALTGGEWLAFLQETCPDVSLETSVGAALTRGPYTPTAGDPGLADLARTWIRRHRGGGVSA